MGKEVFESRGLGGREELVIHIKLKAGELHELLRQIDMDMPNTVWGPNDTSAAAVLKPRPPECKRLAAIARTNLEQAVMWAVKAVSRGQ
jgi:hypothetical protein